ncbi:MAG: adenine phosphoribosyltransferase [Bacteriovoracaceae bacterium]|nr:adenine phosphoribosyltransferase [Bacteriovoracaceae bacterium]
MHPLEKYIRSVQDFPKPGIGFKDIMPIMKDHLPEMIAAMSEGINWNEIDYVIGIESRGFILGSALALMNKKGFIPVRKKGKLPPPLLSQEYALEYGTDTLEMAVNDKPARVLLVDDVLATGGTLNATKALCERNQFKVSAMVVFINLSFLNNFKSSGQPIHSVLTY